MLKKLDQYIIKTFFGPFLFIFSVLFFIFMVNIVWIQLSQFTGKGLSNWEIVKFLFYLSVNVVKMVLPLTILLASIMTFGDFGERYELAAMKSAGISLTRIMMPLFVVVSLLSIMLFVFSNNVIPDFQRKAKNMMYNIAATKPAINFTAGQFINSLPGATVKFDKIYGENGEHLEGVFVHKVANAYEDQRTIIAKKGEFTPAANRNFLKLVLYDGYIFEDNIQDKNYLERLKQPGQSVKFDSLVQHFDVSDVINKAIEDEKITDDYRFQNYKEINKTIVKVKKENDFSFNSINSEMVGQTNNYVTYIDKIKNPAKPTEPFAIEKLKEDKRLEVLYQAYTKISFLQNEKKNKDTQILDIVKYYNKIIMYQQGIIAYSVTCLIFFMIGASLGSIIRKGGVGLPVVIAIIIFIVFYVMNLTVENITWKGKLNPYFGAWLSNLVLFPFGVWLTYKALTDSQVFDVEKYKALTKPLWSKFVKEREHERYQ
ncbi:LptF/LptG family permease [Cloacibacterium sp. Arc13]|uniref:LptF/LptG family permease n=1 Tax=unclassified Cloacibacterium TaxID=2620870 RepID=UPI00352F1AB4